MGLSDGERLTLRSSDCTRLARWFSLVPKVGQSMVSGGGGCCEDEDEDEGGVGVGERVWGVVGFGAAGSL